jgi:hypothetical protein
VIQNLRGGIQPSAESHSACALNPKRMRLNAQQPHRNLPGRAKKFGRNEFAGYVQDLPRCFQITGIPPYKIRGLLA